MREEAPPTVFVIPPNDSLLCPLHFGVFEEPVDAPCGCTFCRRCIMNELSTKAECPVHGTTLLPEYLRENMQAQGAIDNLLVHCEGGLQKTTTGEWVTNPMGCRIWLSLGKRKGHEDICPYIKRSGERVPPPVRTCYYREHGCLFVGNSEQDVMVHGTSCGYGRLLHHLEQIHAQLALRDAEIARLNSLLAEKEKSTISLPNVPNVNEVLDSITRGLEKLDHDSTRLFEDAKDTLKKTKTNIVNSAAYQTSLQVLHSIKEVVESAKSEFIAKLDELISKQKVRMITNTSTNKTSSTNTHNNNNNNTNTNNNSTTTTATESTGVKETEEKLPSSTVASTTTQNIAENSLPSVNAIAEDSNKTETEGDADLHEFLEASKREYLRDQEARLVEEESIRQAVRLSLLDLANKSH